MDLAIAKEFRIRENHKIEFRAEAFNLTNSFRAGIPQARRPEQRVWQLGGSGLSTTCQYFDVRPDSTSALDPSNCGTRWRWGSIRSEGRATGALSMPPGSEAASREFEVSQFRQCGQTVNWTVNTPPLIAGEPYHHGIRHVKDYFSDGLAAPSRPNDSPDPRAESIRRPSFCTALRIMGKISGCSGRLTICPESSLRLERPRSSAVKSSLISKRPGRPVLSTTLRSAFVESSAANSSIVTANASHPLPVRRDMPQTAGRGLSGSIGIAGCSGSMATQSPLEVSSLAPPFATVIA